jgi:hypothetical protein
MQKCQQCVSIASMHYLLRAPSGLGSIASASRPPSGTHDAVCSRTLRPVAPAPVARGRPTEEQVAVYVVAQYSHHGRKGVGIVIVDTHDNTRHITGGTIPTYLLSRLDSFATNSRRRSRAFFPGTVPGPRRAFVERLHGSPQGVYRRIQQRPRDGGFGVRPTRQ